MRTLFDRLSYALYLLVDKLADVLLAAFERTAR